MQRKFIAAIIAATMAGAACAQVPPPAPTAMTSVPPPPVAGQPVAGAAPGATPNAVPLPPGALPPLPPGCVTGAPPAPPPPAMGLFSGYAIQTALDISASEAARVRQVLEQQSDRAQRLDEQHRALDAQTCQQLHDIVGDQGFMRWMSATPPPPGPPPPPPPPPPPRD